MNILALSGSLRKDSYNASLVKAIKKLQTNNISIEIFSELDKLPFFNPDLDIHTLEHDSSPSSVVNFRKKISSSDIFLLSTPEYAFQMPGVLKNALDWLVSSSAIVNKPIIVISASTSAMGGDKAFESLVSLMNVISTKVIEDASFKVPRINKKINLDGEIIDSELIQKIEDSLQVANRYITKQSSQ